MIFDFETIPTREAYKLMVSTVVPRPIAWLVSQDKAGVVNAAPFSFFNCFGDKPPVVGIGIGPNPDGSLKDSLRNIQETGQFTVNLVSEATAEAMNLTAIDFPPEVDELAAAGLTARASRKIAVPCIDESPVSMECETFQLVPVGHHMLVLGRVVAMHVRDDCVLNAEKYYVDTKKLELVGRMAGRGGYVRTQEGFEIERITYKQWSSKA